MDVWIIIHGLGKVVSMVILVIDIISIDVDYNWT